MKEKCHCGKEANFLYYPKEGGETKCYCCEHVPEIVLQYEYCPEGILKWNKTNPLRGGDKSTGI